MSPILDHLLVAAALSASGAYALYALGPRSWRRRTLSMAAAWAASLPPRRVFQRWAAKLLAASSSGSGKACGGCDNCGDSPGETGEIKVPLERIGRRTS